MFQLSLLYAALPELLNGALVTIELTVSAAIVSLAVGTLSAMAQVARLPVLWILSRLYVSLMRGTPALVQLFVVFFGLPRLGLGGHPFLAAAIAIGLNSGAYVTEILRGAVLAVPAGELEAGRAIGMKRVRIWSRIILPRAFLWSLPALANEATLLLKTTPLASVVAITELTFSGQMIIARSYRPTEILLAVAASYIALSLLLTQLAQWLERRWSLSQA